VIEPRNQLEHFYQFPRRDGAGHAVEIAGLFISATDAEARQSSIVAVGWNALGGSFINNLSERVEFRGFSDHPMLFLDVFENPAVAKIVDPKSHEIRWAALSSFTREEALELAKLLRRVGEGSSAQMSEFFFREIKRQGCF
jgi:hypothetical protein